VFDWLLVQLDPIPFSVFRRVPPAGAATAAAPASPRPLAGPAEGESVVRHLRSLLPPQAFRTDAGRLGLLVINLAILGLGWTMARGLDRWSWGALPLFLPFSLVMGNAVIVLLFASHDLLHGSAVRGQGWRRAVGLLGLALLWMPPTLWQAVHNREHHGHTNTLRDPDRSYMEQQPDSWGKWIQHRFTPSDEVSGLGLLLGMASAWGVHNLRTLASVLLVPNGTAAFPPAPFVVSPRERRRILVELLAVVALHAGVIAWIGPSARGLLLGYFLPIWLGYAGAMAYIFTNHLLAPLEESPDPLRHSLSLRVPPLLDLLHLNFSHHTEHHLFPGLNSSYYPLVRRLLEEHYGDRYQLLAGGEAWRLLLSTPRHYRSATVVCSADGSRAMALPRLSGQGG